MKFGITSTSYGEAYYKHPVFEKIEHMMDYYEGVYFADLGCQFFVLQLV